MTLITHIVNTSLETVYLDNIPIKPGGKHWLLLRNNPNPNHNPNPDMNAEQLARDIKSLDQAHRAADEALKPYPGLSIGAKVESLVKNNISIDCSRRIQEHLSRVDTTPHAWLDERVKELVDELLKRREDPALKEIREIVSKALGYSHEAISGTTTAGLVEMLARECKAKQDQGVLEKLHREFDRAEPRYLGGVIERARRAVDELLKLRQQGSEAAGNIYDLNKQLEALKAEQGEIRRKVGEALGKDAMEIRALTTQEIVYMLIYRLGETKQGETNNSILSERDRREIREKMFKALGKAEDPSMPTTELVETLIQKHQQLHDNFRLLQHFLSGQPKGLAPKEKWGVYPIGQGSYRVMRGNEDATPHPVSKGIADAIAGELNGR